MANLDRSDRLIELCLDVAQGGGSANLLIFIEDIFEVCSDPYFDVRRDLNQVLTVNYMTKLVVEILISTLNNSTLHSLELFTIEGHPLSRAILANLVLYRFK